MESDQLTRIPSQPSLVPQSDNKYFYVCICMFLCFMIYIFFNHKSQQDQKMIRKLKKQIKRQKSQDLTQQVSKSGLPDSAQAQPQSKEKEQNDKNSNELQSPPSLQSLNELRKESSYHELDQNIIYNRRMRESSLDHPKALSKSKHPVTRICLTGGPCAGKTTAIATLSSTLTQMGFKVLEVPEAATLLMKGGAMIQTRKLNFADAVKFQISVMKMQMSLEDIFIQIALTQDQPTIIICDRGVMDGSAYTDDKVWQAILDETGWSTIQLRDRRYEAVIHMVTAADGAEEFYQKENNAARYENVKEAIELDKKLINGWVGHPHFSIIDNKEGGFNNKIDKCLDRVFKFIGLPTPSSYYKKFLLITRQGDYDIQVPKNVKKEIFQVEDTFLIATGEQVENFIRKIGKNDSFTYSHEIRYSQNDERIIKKRQISARQYIEMFEQRDPAMKQLKKFRQCFIYEQQYFMVDSFINADGSPSLLRIETTKQESQIKIPPFVKILREVTEDDHYASRNIAKQNYKMPENDRNVIRQTLQGLPMLVSPKKSNDLPNTDEKIPGISEFKKQNSVQPPSSTQQPLSQSQGEISNSASNLSVN